MSEHKASWLPLFVLGGLIGAGLALLFAPRTGKDTREKLKGMARESAERFRRHDERVETR